MQVKAVFTLKNVPSVFTEVVEVERADLDLVKDALALLIAKLGMTNKVDHVTYIEQIKN